MRSSTSFIFLKKNIKMLDICPIFDKIMIQVERSGAKWWGYYKMDIGFCGEYQHTIDLKGRVIVPSKLREGLGEKFIVTKGFDKCLFVFSLEGWEKFLESLKGLPMSNTDARTFMRFFFAGACECTVDKQGRILLPQNLREYGELEKEICVIGVATRVEIWDKKKWEKYNIDNVDLDSIAENMQTNNLII